MCLAEMMWEHHHLRHNFFFFLSNFLGSCFYPWPLTSLTCLHHHTSTHLPLTHTDPVTLLLPCPTPPPRLSQSFMRPRNKSLQSQFTEIWTTRHVKAITPRHIGTFFPTECMSDTPSHKEQEVLKFSHNTEKEHSNEENYNPAIQVKSLISSAHLRLW